MCPHPSGGRPSRHWRPGSSQQWILQLTQPEAGQPLAEPRALDGGLGRGGVKLGRRSAAGCGVFRLDRRVGFWFVRHADRHPGKCQGAVRSASIVFKDGAAKTGERRPGEPARLYRPKVLFDRVLACILRVELRVGAAAVVAAGPQRFAVRRNNPAWRQGVARDREPVAVIRRSRPFRYPSLRSNARAGIRLPFAAGHARVLQLPPRAPSTLLTTPAFTTWQIETRLRPHHRSC